MWENIFYFSLVGKENSRQILIVGCEKLPYAIW